ncbi:MAG: MOSC domain-containing protein, partial [Verrucomicrobiaceae bacterium]
MSTPEVIALFTGKTRQIEAGESGQWWDKTWQTGFYKEPVTDPCWLGYEGFRSDEQADRRFHGGPEKAVCVYSSEHYPYWLGELGIPELTHGGFGENLTIQNLTESEVCIGDRFSLGEAEVQVSQPRQPCWKLARRWQVKDLALRVEQTGFTGFYFRVRRHGHVRAGDRLELIERPFPQWSIARCNEIMHHLKQDAVVAGDLAHCPLLSSSWKDSLWMRAEKKSAPSTSLRT